VAVWRIYVRMYAELARAGYPKPIPNNTLERQVLWWG
jgi:hypothetical protein